MVYVDELSLKYAEVYNVTRFYRIKLGIISERMFLYFSLYNAERKACSVNRNVYLLEQIRNCAYVVLVAVGYEHGSYFIGILHEVRNIGYYEVYAEHILVGKSHTAIDNDYVVTVFKRGHIFAYLSKTAKRYYLELSAPCPCGLSILFYHFLSSSVPRNADLLLCKFHRYTRLKNPIKIKIGFSAVSLSPVSY